jgi:hypothetical protein
MKHGMPMMDSYGWIFILFFLTLLFVGVVVLVRIFNSKSEDLKSAKGKLPEKTV